MATRSDYFQFDSYEWELVRVVRLVLSRQTVDMQTLDIAQKADGSKVSDLIESGLL